MKRIISLILVLSLLVSMTACAANGRNESTPVLQPTGETGQVDPAPSTVPQEDEDAEPQGSLSQTDFVEVYEPPKFTGLNDAALLRYMEDNIYSGLADALPTEDYIIENVETVYVSKEYIEELNYNSQVNLFFGYTLAELDEQFQGTRYVFTLGEDGQTAVQPFEAYDDTYDRVLKNVAIGTGVILVCVTVSVVTAGAGLTTVSVVFAASAKTAAIEGLSGGFFGGLAAGIIEGVRTGDFDAALKAAALAGSEGFKWGAISGSIVGAATELRTARHAADALDNVDDAANLVDDVANAADDAADSLDDILNGVDEVSAGSVEIADDLKPWQKAELRALNDKGGYDQLAFQDGKIVSRTTTGSTRPDVVRVIGDHLEAVEVKYYDLSNPDNCRVMYKELLREVTDRITHLPQGSTQRIILDVTDRGFDAETVYKVVDHILELLDDVYPNIPIDVVGLL